MSTPSQIESTGAVVGNKDVEITLPTGEKYLYRQADEPFTYHDFGFGGHSKRLDFEDDTSIAFMHNVQVRFLRSTRND